MARKKKDATAVLPELDANRHHDTRKNIPTEEHCNACPLSPPVDGKGKGDVTDIAR
jgi:hypothetical protein